MQDKHDIHDFVISSQKDIEKEYTRIQKRAVEDPGTAGDQGEENWATLLRSWLPSYFHIVTKGRILTASGYTSPQIDVIVLAPSYPQILFDKKLYLSGGVVAAFECKTTLKAEHIRSAVKTSSLIRQNLPRRIGTPYKEFNSTIIYGLLAHSHSWKSKLSSPLENITNTLEKSDNKYVKHPRDCMDFLCVADLGTWNIVKLSYPSSGSFFNSDKTKNKANKEIESLTSYTCHAIGQKIFGNQKQKPFFSPIGTLLSGLYSKLAWMFPDMRNLEEYFRSVGIGGNYKGKIRKWDTSVYTEAVKHHLYNSEIPNSRSNPYDEWAYIFNPYS